MKRRVIVAAGLVVVTMLCVPASAVSEGTPVQAGPEHEWRPAAAVGWLVWSEDGGTGDLAYNTWAKEDGSSPFKINDAGTLGYGGGIDGTTVIHQQVKGTKSDLKLFDLITKTNSNPPSGINSKFWEWGGKIAADWVLFNRNNSNLATTRKWQKVILYDRNTQSFATLDSVRGSNSFLGATSVSGGMLAWTKCGKTCDVYVYDTATKTKTKVPGPAGLQYDGTLVPDGTLYFVHDSGGCGKSARIMRWTGGSPEAVGSLPKGVNAYYTFALTQLDGSDSVLYTRWKCSTGATDVYSLDNADTLPPLAPAVSSGGGSGYLRPQGWTFGG